MGEVSQEFFSYVLARLEGDLVLRGHGKIYMVMLFIKSSLTWKIDNIYT